MSWKGIEKVFERGLKDIYKRRGKNRSGRKFEGPEASNSTGQPGNGKY